MIDRLAPRPEYDEHVAARLPDCHVPTLIVWGDRDGTVLTPKRTHIPAVDAQLHLPADPRCPHEIQGNRPEVFAETVSDVLTRGTLFLFPETSSIINP